MKHLLKHPSHFMKLIALLLFFSVFNCQKEDLSAPNQTQELSSVSYKITSLSKLTKLQPVVENIKKLSPKTNTYNRGFGDVLPLENIDTTRVIQYTDTTGYSTYTFKIENDDETSINFENLYLLETEQGYIGYILRYEPDPDWYNSHLIFQHSEYALNMQDYQGDITKYSFEREVIWSTIEENAESSTASRGGQFITVCTYSIGRICTEGNHSDRKGWDGCTATVYDWVDICNTVWSSGGSGNDGGDNGSDPSGGGDGSDPCITTGTTIIGQQPISGVGTSCTPNEGTGVLIPQNKTVDEKNCEELKKLFETPNYVINPPEKSPRNAIIDLENNLNHWNEKGYTLRHNASFKAMAAPVSNTNYESVKYSNYPNIYGGCHTHQDDDKTIPMFSHQDIKALLKFSENYNSGLVVDNSLFVHVLVTHQGTYAIKINDIAKLQALNDIYADDGDANGDGKDEFENFERKLNKKYQRYVNNLTSTINGSPLDYQKEFLKFITQDYDLGISLYEASDNLTNWKKVELSTENSNTLIKTNCN